MNLEALAKSIRFDNASKGFDPTEGGVERYLLLTISEICEAQDQLRDGHTVHEIWFKGGMKPFHAGASLESFPNNAKPEGFPVEIADAIIRILDIQAKLELVISLFGTPTRTPADEKITLDKELLAIVSTIADCFRKDSNITLKLNWALSALLAICEYNDIQIMNVINLKLAYNRTRPPKHGRKF